MKRAIALILSLILIICTVGCSKQSDDSAVDVYLEMAQEYLDEGDYDAAIETLEKGLDSTGSTAIEEKLKEAISLQLDADSSSAVVAPNDEADSEGSNKDAVSSDGVPSEEKMIEDILSCGANVFSVNNQNEYFEISTLSLLRRKTDTGFDEAHVSVAFENDYYTVSAELILYYEFYDVGGWVLDQYQINGYESSAKKSNFDELTFGAYMCDAFVCDSYDACVVTDRKSIRETDGTYREEIYFTMDLSQPYLTHNVDCVFQMSFYDNYWHETLQIVETSFDMSGVSGYWSHGEYGEKLQLGILDIQLKANGDAAVSYCYETSAWNGLNTYNTVPYSIDERTDNLKLKTSELNVLGQTLLVPESISLYLQIGTHPQISEGYVGYKETFEFVIDFGNGVYIKELPDLWQNDDGTLTWSGHGDEDVACTQSPYKNVQEALDALEEMN